MADGESQLPAVVADRWLSDFSGAVSRYNLPSLASREDSVDGHGAHPAGLVQEVRCPRGLFGCQGARAPDGVKLLPPWGGEGDIKMFLHTP